MSADAKAESVEEVALHELCKPPPDTWDVGPFMKRIEKLKDFKGNPHLYLTTVVPTLLPSK